MEIADGHVVMQIPKYGLIFSACLVAISAPELSAVTIKNTSAMIIFGNGTYNVDFTVNPKLGFFSSTTFGDQGTGLLKTNLIYDPVEKIFKTNGLIQVSLTELVISCPFGCGSGSVGFVLNLKDDSLKGSATPILSTDLRAYGPLASKETEGIEGRQPHSKAQARRRPSA